MKIPSFSTFRNSRRPLLSMEAMVFLLNQNGQYLKRKESGVRWENRDPYVTKVFKKKSSDYGHTVCSSGGTCREQLGARFINNLTSLQDYVRHRQWQVTTEPPKNAFGQPTEQPQAVFSMELTSEFCYQRRKQFCQLADVFLGVPAVLLLGPEAFIPHHLKTQEKLCSPHVLRTACLSTKVYSHEAFLSVFTATARNLKVFLEANGDYFFKEVDKLVDIAAVRRRLSAVHRVGRITPRQRSHLENTAKVLLVILSRLSRSDAPLNIDNWADLRVLGHERQNLPAVPASFARTGGFYSWRRRRRNVNNHRRLTQEFRKQDEELLREAESLKKLNTPARRKRKKPARAAA